VAVLLTNSDCLVNFLGLVDGNGLGLIDGRWNVDGLGLIDGRWNVDGLVDLLVDGLELDPVLGFGYGLRLRLCYRLVICHIFGDSLVTPLGTVWFVVASESTTKGQLCEEGKNDEESSELHCE